MSVAARMMKNKDDVMSKRPSLYANIAAKKRRIKAGSKEKMRKKEPRARQLQRTLEELHKLREKIND